MSTTLEFTGSVVSPAADCVGAPHGCSVPEATASLGMQLNPIIAAFDRVLSGEFILPVQASYVALPVAASMTTIGILALAIDQDSTPLLVYVGTSPVDAGAVPVTSNLVLTPNGVPGAQVWVKGGPATVSLIAAGT